MSGNNNVLLDSNIVIEVFAGNKDIADKISGLKGNLVISSIVIGELYVGIYRVANKAKHLKMLDDFLNLCIILDADKSTAKLYGEMVSILYKKGKPIPTNDIWIAAIAKQHNLTLISKDKHFAEINGLAIKSW